MAEIEYYAGENGTELYLRLINLDPNYTDPIYRFYKWEINYGERSSGEMRLDEGITETDYYVFDGLASGKSYDIICTVYNIRNENGEYEDRTLYYNCSTLLIAPQLSMRCSSDEAVAEIVGPEYGEGDFPFLVFFDNTQTTFYLTEPLSRIENGNYFTYRGRIIQYYNDDGYFGLTQKTTYPIVCHIGNGSGAFSNTTDFQLFPSLEYVQHPQIVCSQTASSITVSLSAHEIYGFPTCYYVVLFNSQGVNIKSFTVTEVGSVTFDKLEADTYKITVNAYVGTRQPCYFVNDYTEVMIENYQRKFTLTGVKEWQWSWTDEESSALLNNGAVTTLTCDRMNEFAECVKLMLEAKCGTESEYWSYYQSLISKFSFGEDDNVLTAEKFNALRECIGSFNSTGIEEKYPKETVFGSYFLTLADKLNEIK